MPALAGQTATAAQFNLDTTQIVAYAERTTDSSTTTTIVGVLRLDDVPLTGGYLYKVMTSTLHLDSSAIDDHIEARITYTTDGSTPTTASSTLPGGRSQARQSVSASFGEDRAIQALYAPASDETLSLLLCVRRDSGTGSVGISGTGGFVIQMWVEQLGENPGDTGVDI